MRLGLALILLIGFCLSFQGRLKMDFDYVHSSLVFHANDLKHQHKDSRDVPLSRQGDHKDQHGCYHSHAPFVTVATTFNCEVLCTPFIADALEVLHSFTLASILHPPRA
jgi:hypothetical protein